MSVEYPSRPMAPAWVRYSCMMFGLANMLATIAYASRQGIFLLVGGSLVGSAWFAFGAYGGFPLVDTIADWHLPATPVAVDEMHRQGLLVIRRRKWMMYLAIPAALAMNGLLMPPLMRLGHPEFIVLILGVPLGIINFRYLLSRCPRCGFGFFTRSASRAAVLRRRRVCGHCDLSLKALKQPNV